MLGGGELGGGELGGVWVSGTIKAVLLSDDDADLVAKNKQSSLLCCVTRLSVLELGVHEASSSDGTDLVKQQSYDPQKMGFR